MKNKGLVKYHGGCSYKAKWVYSLFPKSYNKYVEPFVGAGSVFLNKDISPVEVIADKSYGMYSLWNQLKRNPHNVISTLNSLEYSEETFEKYKGMKPTTEIDMAVREFVIHQCSRGGLCKNFAWSERLRRGMPGDVSGWLSAINHLTWVSERLSNTYILHGDFERLMKPFLTDSETLFFLDPTFLSETRVAKQCYEHEMGIEDHQRLLDLCKQIKGKVLLLGYENEMYNKELVGWNKAVRETINHSGQNKKKQKRIDMAWYNYEISDFHCVTEHLKNKGSKKVKERMISIGILDKEGNLTKKYGGNS